MCKRMVLKCPYCGATLLKVSICKEVEIECRECGASLLTSKEESGSCVVSARPRKAS